MQSVPFKLSTGDHQNRLKLSKAPEPPVSLDEKHRPRDLASIVGQGEATIRIESFLEAPYSSAWFFDGPTGVGKTTLALAMAAELGACHFGGLERIGSGMQDAEAVERALNNLRYTPMLGSGWKVIIVDEADYMSHKASQLWLSSLEELPDRSVVIFTTNKPAKFDDRFIDRCQHIVFASQAAEHTGDAQELVNRVWNAETGSLHGAPNAKWLKGVVDDNGAISYRRVIRALEPLLALRNSRATADRSINDPGEAEARSAHTKACDAIFTPLVVVPRTVEAAPAVPTTPATPKPAKSKPELTPELIAKRKASAQKGLETWRRNQENLRIAAGHFTPSA